MLCNESCLIYKILSWYGCAAKDIKKLHLHLFFLKFLGLLLFFWSFTENLLCGGCGAVGRGHVSKVRPNEMIFTAGNILGHRHREEIRAAKCPRFQILMKLGLHSMSWIISFLYESSNLYLKLNLSTIKYLATTKFKIILLQNVWGSSNILFQLI